jgi:hypothetical protein
LDTQWLSNEARSLHDLFSSLFYVIILTCLTIGIITEYFKITLGAMPQFTHLVGRVAIACILLLAFPEIMNMLAGVTDEVSKEIGQLNQFKLVLTRMGERLGQLSFSWVRVKDAVLLVISFLTFFLLYITVYLADSFFMFSWMMLYILSPVLIALFVLPATASATRALFKSMFEVCAWKCVWGVLAALLWSFALSDINRPEAGVTFLSAIILNLMLAFSVMLTPKITSAFLGGGISAVADSFGATMMGAASFTPGGLVTGVLAKNLVKRSVGKSSFLRKAIRSRRQRKPKKTTPEVRKF